MSRPLIADAFAHHAWATLRLIDACLPLTQEQLDAVLPGTYGSILATIRHLVGADASYLSLLSGGRVEAIDDEQMSLAELRAVAEGMGPAWGEFLAGDLDPDVVVIRHRDDGSESLAPLGIRVAQALHHGSDHRSQVCTALTSLGIEPPEIDVWALGDARGQLSEVPPPQD